MTTRSFSITASCKPEYAKINAVDSVDCRNTDSYRSDYQIKGRGPGHGNRATSEESLRLLNPVVFADG